MCDFFLFIVKMNDLEERKNWNVFILGLGFFLNYTGYLTSAGASETVLIGSRIKSYKFIKDL